MEHPRLTARLPRLPLLLRTSLGLAVLALGTSVVGAGVVALLLALAGVPTAGSTAALVLLVVAAGYVVLACVVGTAWAVLVQRRTVVWVATGREPTLEDARRALRLPMDVSRATAVLWLLGAVAHGVLAAALDGAWTAVAVVTAVALGGLVTSGLAYLLAERVTRPLTAMALRVAPPGHSPAISVRTRLVVAWAVTSAVPLLGVLLIIVLPTGSPQRALPSIALLAGASTFWGGLATVLLARSLANPLRGMRRALDRVTAGDREVAVPVDAAGEIGLLQGSVNELARSLREQERTRDLFGRHVGEAVASHALRDGVSLEGEVRWVAALFVDVVDSTALAHRLPPREIVGKLNRFFRGVVDAVDAHGGLVNKFAGDAALCVFGAPEPLADPATAALRAARAIRDAVRATGELDLGIGVAVGEVFAGQLGTRERLEYTVIGDAVNEAARLTDHAKKVPGRILASEALLESAADEERARWTSHGDLVLRGRDAPTRTWQVA